MKVEQGVFVIYPGGNKSNEGTDFNVRYFYLRLHDEVSATLRSTDSLPSLVTISSHKLNILYFMYKERNGAKLKKSVDMKSSGMNGLNIRTNASLIWEIMTCKQTVINTPANGIIRRNFKKCRLTF